MFQEAAKSEETTKDWNMKRLQVIPKVRAPSTPKHCRLVTIAQLMEKIYRKCLLEHIKTAELVTFSTFQCGGLPGRQAAEVLMTIRLIIQQGQWLGIPIFMVKLDIRAAFD